jgi:Family of unknown function (DUF6049)
MPRQWSRVGPPGRIPARFAAVAAALVAAALAVLPAAAASAGVRTSAGLTASAGVTAGRAAHAAGRLSIAITSVSPQIARPGQTVTVSGIVANPTNAAVAGLSVQLWSASTPLSDRAAMASYLTEPPPTGVDYPVGQVQPLAGLVPARTTRTWSMRLRLSQVGMRDFGVYPLAAELSGGDVLLEARTFLPYWPGKKAARSLKPLNLSWVWPLVDVPHRAACQALLSNSLAHSLAPGGRLASLLAAGQTAAARQADLTWAIDPALVSDAKVMTGPYRVGGNNTCGGSKAMPASKDAQAWYAGVRSVARQQNFFATPYADVDVAALAHQGLNGDLASAFTDGQVAAKRLLGASQRTTPAISPGIAWPPDGIADYSVLEGLAARNLVHSVILDSAMMPPATPVPYTPTAVTSTPDGLGARMNVLLADDTLTRILGAPRDEIPGTVPAPSPVTGSSGLAQASAFAKDQWFLAETAMIAAEAPHVQRSVVVAPPRRWNPQAGLAGALLTSTGKAPWLRVTSLASLLTSHRGHIGPPRRQPPQRRLSPAELRAPLLRQVRHLTGDIRLLGSILTSGGPGYLSTAVAAVESSAWRGGRADQRRAAQLLHQVSSYVFAQFQQVEIIDPQRITLGGKSGAIPVSVSNRLNRQIRVKLEVRVPSSGRVTIGHFHDVITVAPKSQRTIKIPVRVAAAGSTTLTLRLATPGGRPLPVRAAPLTVQATHFGTLAIVIIVVALVVFVITAAGRAIRRGGGPAGSEEGDGSEPGQQVTGPDPAYPGEEADNVVSGSVPAEPDPPAHEPVRDSRTGSGGTGYPDTAKEADEHASTPGRADRR